MKRQQRKTVWGKKAVHSALLAALAALLAGCSQPQEYQESSVYAMDTIMRFQVLASPDSNLEGVLRDEVQRVDLLLSATDPDSELYQLNHREGEAFTASQELADILDGCLEISRETGGALNIALYPVTQAWGFTTGDYHVPDAATLSDAMEKIHWEEIEMDGTQVWLPEGMELDLGAVGKGYLTDRCVELLRENQVSSALLDLGGNIYAHGRKEDGTAWRIGIQDPSGQGLVASFTAEDEAVVTSGTYQRYFEADGKRYHHILDSGTGYPVENGLESVTIVTDNGFLADALSTSLFVLGLEDSVTFWREQYPQVGVVWVTSQGEVYYTENLEDRFTPAGGITSHLVEA